MANSHSATYNDTVVRQFAVAAVVWGVVGMAVGVLIASQLAWPELNFGIPWLSYGRLRPLHTNAVIFAFGGCALFATSYHVVQRTCQTRLFAGPLASFTFWGWQLVILLAAISLPLGYTTGKEYAELEWPIDLLITVVWVSYAIVFFGTVGIRKVRHIYVANWFYGAFIIAVALLHIVNSAEMPVLANGILAPKSYSVYAGVQDAMVQWWYGHNAVGFFLTAGFLGMMYYYIPKQAGMPVYSYRLSIVHFWALIFTYMWAGPHHLHYTALPDWTQSVGCLVQAARRRHPEVPDRGPVLLRHVPLRRSDDVHQDRELAVALHRLDGRPRALRRLGLGGSDLDGFLVLPDPAHVRPSDDVLGASHLRALLGSDHRHRAVHRFHVDCRRDAGPDVACGQPRRHPGLQLRRERQVLA